VTIKQSELQVKQQEYQVSLKEKTLRHMGDNQTAKFKERETYNQILEFMQRSDVKAVFKKNQVGLRKYFKFYASLGNHEIGVDLEHYMN